LRRLLSAPALHGYRPIWSLHHGKRSAGVCCLLRPGLHLATLQRFNLSAVTPPLAHHPEGRVIVLEFATLRLLFTYSPNSGLTRACAPRRAACCAQRHHDG
jgi:exonuclease III